MTLYLDKVFSDKFIENYVIRALKEKIISSVHSKNLSQVNEFLKSEYGINVDTVLSSMEFSVNRVSDVYVISIDNNTIEEKSQEKVISLIKLIEYGNLKIKGLNVINDSFKYIKKHLKLLYRLYQMRGGR